jgi:hypothetical protein
VVHLDAHRKKDKPPPARRVTEGDDLPPAAPEKPPEWEALPEGVDPDSRQGIYAQVNAVMEGARRGRVGGQKIAGMASLFRLKLEMVREDEAKKQMQKDRLQRGDGLPPPPSSAAMRITERVTERVVERGGAVIEYRDADEGISYPLPPSPPTALPPPLLGEHLLTEMEQVAMRDAELVAWEAMRPPPLPGR